MTTTGMNLAEVRRLADRLGQAAEQLRHTVSSVDGHLANTSWAGHDADVFKHQWWPGHRQRLLVAAERMGGLGRSAANNADAQERASSPDGTGGSSAVTGSDANRSKSTPPDWSPTTRSQESGVPQGPGAFSNAAIVAAAKARPIGSAGGQCRAFVGQVVSDATGGRVTLEAYANPAHDYFVALEQNGARMTDVAQLRPGDVVQIGQFESDRHLHTFLIDGTPTQRPDGTWWVHVIDSNSEPIGAPETVRAYDRQISLSDVQRAYRLGKV